MKILNIRARSVAAVILIIACQQVFAQEKQTVQIKTFDQQLQPYRDIEVSVNGKEFINVGTKASAFIELTDADFPLKTITIKNQELEAASWIYSKGVVEITVRKKSYQMTTLVVRDSKNQPLPDHRVLFRGKRTFEGKTDIEGKMQIPLARDEVITSLGQFTLANVDLKGISSRNNEIFLIADKIEPVAATVAIPKTAERSGSNAKEYFKDFNLSQLDSIQSLTAFYSIFKGYEIKGMDEESKRQVDQKFNSLVAQLQDSARNRRNAFLGKITDSTFVMQDIRNMISQATSEANLLTDQRSEFDAKIAMITQKLEAGVGNLDEATRAELLRNLALLEQLLIDNESRFFKNQNDYRQIINAIREKYFNLTDLESKLTQSEAQRLEEQRVFKQRLLIILGIAFVFACLIVLLISFSAALRKEKKKLAEANAAVQHMNDNLEVLVAQRTEMLTKAHRELDTFLYRASHDMRSPVRSIIGLCNIAGRLLHGEVKDLIDRVVSTSHGMDRLLKKLSAISEINQPSSFSSANLRDTIAQAQETFQPLIRSHKVEFIVDCPEDIVVHTYPTIVQTILQNLIENSIAFTVQNPYPRVEVIAKTQDSNVQLLIRDNGIGIEPQIQQNVFDMFFKGTERSTGNGLGLYIVSKGVQALNGEIRVESTPNVSTTFVVTLPMEFKAEIASASLLVASA